ncbi:hypothetical protein [Acidaminococcus fermentans]|uniref:hypothetical protein n=1 Tax=Acidaminococcus fermentans TaxID=905 RepID=UPI003F8BFB86
MDNKSIGYIIVSLIIACVMIFGGNDKPSKNQTSQASQEPNYMLLAKEDIEKRTGLYVTDFSIKQSNVAKAQNGNVTVDSDIKLDNKKETQHFWAIYTEKGKLLRLKIGPNVMYDAQEQDKNKKQ